MPERRSARDLIRAAGGSRNPAVPSVAILALAAVVVLALAWGSGPGPSAGPSLRPSTASATGGSAEPPAPTSGPTTGAGTPSSGAGTQSSAPALPEFGHAFVIVMENKGFDSIIGNPAAPYINGLASRYALATAYTAVAHPSEPNYLALWSGSTQGVTDDGVYDFTSGRTLGDQIEASGRSWHVAAQNVPPSCYAGSSASGGEDGAGTYARKHEPAISWTSVSGNPSRCVRITDFSHFDANLGDFWLIVPNLCNDMHDCSVATGDAFLQAWLPVILQSPAFSSGVVFLTWDEGSSDSGGGGRVPTIVISPFAKAGLESPVDHSHYSLLRTIETAWGLPCLGNACSANDLRDLFR